MCDALEFINIGGIVGAFHRTIRKCKWVFYAFPLVLGLSAPLLLRGGNNQAIVTLNAFLTSFVPLFATILTFYMSWCYKKMRTRQFETRLDLFKETSTCILLMIPIAAIALVAYVVSRSQMGSGIVLEEWLFEIGITLPSCMEQVTVNDVLRYILLAIYYMAVVELLLILLMVCKRAHTIITKEIEFLIDEHKREETKDRQESENELRVTIESTVKVEEGTYTCKINKLHV